MKRIFFAGLIILFSTASAYGSILVTATETGGNVVFEGGGRVFLYDDNLVYEGPGNFSEGVNAGLGTLAMGQSSSGSKYRGVQGPSNFGIGSGFTPTNYSAGQPHERFFYIDGNGDSTGSLIVAGDFEGNGFEPLFLYASMMFEGQTFESMGLTQGTYVWHWGAGENLETYTLQIGSVPEPTTFVIWGAGLIGSILFCGRRNRAA